MKLYEQTPDMGHGWVRYTLKPWPGSRRLWLDLFGRELGRAATAAADVLRLPNLADVDDVVYLPPIDESDPAAGSLRQRLLGRPGPPLLIHRLPADGGDSLGSTEVFDVLEAVATLDLSGLEAVPPQGDVIWPLIGGYTDDTGQWNDGLEILKSRGVRCVVGIAVNLAPVDRRRVVEIAGDRGYDRLFHGPTPSERDFSRAVHRFGMAPFLERPLPVAPARVRRNRRLAGVLASIGELWLRLGRAESRGQSFYRAARWVDRESHDLIRLAREGNLDIVDWLDDESRDVIRELAGEGASSLLRELEEEYLSPATGG